MEQQITVIARFKVKSESTTEFLELVAHLVENTRKEAGCLIYNYHRDLKDDTLFFSHELWANAEALAKHFEQPYILEAFRVAPNLLSEPVEIRNLVEVSKKA